MTAPVVARVPMPPAPALRMAATAILAAQGVHWIVGVAFPQVAPKTERERLLTHVARWLLQAAGDLELAAERAKEPAPIIVITKPGEPR